MIENAASKASTDPDFDHPFFHKVAEYVQAGDRDRIIKEKIPIKLLRLTPAAQEGAVIVDFPYELKEAELMEEYRGGLNAFVHVSLPDEVLVDIEETKLWCADENKYYYKSDVISEEHGVYIQAHMPQDDYLDLTPASDPMQFEKDLSVYHSKKDDLLAFYNELGLLVDFEPRNGWEDYEKLKRQIQYNIKH